MTVDDLPPLPEPYEGATRWVYYDAGQVRAEIAKAVESETSELRATLIQSAEVIGAQLKEMNDMRAQVATLSAELAAMRAEAARQHGTTKGHADYPCRNDGRCQYAIDSGAEGLGHCPRGKCVILTNKWQP